MVGDTSFFSRCSIASVHIIQTQNCFLYRFQGVALPKGIIVSSDTYFIFIDCNLTLIILLLCFQLNSYAYDILLTRGQKLVRLIYIFSLVLHEFSGNEVKGIITICSSYTISQTLFKPWTDRWARYSVKMRKERTPFRALM